MSAPAARIRSTAWLALLAVTLLAWAGVRSTVMQAQMTAGACGSTAAASMAGMRMADAPARAGKSAPAKAAPCEYCAAAAHAPTQTAAVRFDPPITTATFARYEMPASLGPRGPPRQPPKARGPPAPLSA